MRSRHSVYLLVGVVMVLACASCSVRPQPVSISVRSQSNAIDVQDSQRIHIDGKRVDLHDVRAQLQSMALSHTVPVHVEVGWKCDPALLGELVEQLLSIEPRRTLLIERAQE